MSWSGRKEVRYWTDEFEGFARRFRWVLIGLMILTLVDLLATWLPFVWWLNGFLALIFAPRRLRVWGNIDEALHRAQQRSISRRIVAAWPALAQTLRLEAHGPSGSRIAAGIGSPRWDADACLVTASQQSGSDSRSSSQSTSSMRCLAATSLTGCSAGSKRAHPRLWIEWWLHRFPSLPASELSRPGEVL